MLSELTASLQKEPCKRHALWELCHCVASAINAPGYTLYLTVAPVEGSEGVLELYKSVANGDEVDCQTDKWSVAIGQGSFLCAWVASNRQAVRVSSADADSRFPDGCPVNKGASGHLLGMPVVQSGGQLEAVMEFYRGADGDPFYEEDEEIVNSYLVWGAIALHYSDLYKNMLRQKTLNDFMLSVVKSIFQDMVSMDNLIMKVMNYAQTLVSADRASLFLLDSKSKCLFARIFDMGVNVSTEDEEPPCNVSEEIRFPVGTGIAGIVAQTGEVLNIPDAYADDRFNRSVDLLTGYVTKTILCMPIYIRGNVIGVMQMVNKNMGTFTKDDEEAFEMFAVYCGLALHHAKLYDKIRRSEQKYKCLSLFVGSLCHDVDHRGKNNKFMLESESPLAAIYTTSTLERHHFNQTVTILQQEGHNIFSKLTSSEYKQVLSNIKHCILATDLALFFPTKAKLNTLLEEGTFDWDNLEHRLLVQAIAMTGSDLCASTKPWEVQVQTVKIIFEEFYEQGDAEKASGKVPIPMMDRDKQVEQPMSQVGFLKFICIPCYELLMRLIPVTEPMLQGCNKNYQRWKAIAEETKKKIEVLEAQEEKTKEDDEKNGKD